MFFFCSVADEESTIEEQEVMEGEADHKAELVDLAKDGISFSSTIATNIFQFTQAILDIVLMLHTVAGMHGNKNGKYFCYLFNTSTLIIG